MNLILLESNRDSYYYRRSIIFYTKKGYHIFGPFSKVGDPRFYYDYYDFGLISNDLDDVGTHGFYIEEEQ